MVKQGEKVILERCGYESAGVASLLLSIDWSRHTAEWITSGKEIGRHGTAIPGLKKALVWRRRIMIRRTSLGEHGVCSLCPNRRGWIRDQARRLRVMEFDEDLQGRIRKARINKEYGRAASLMA